MAENVFTPKLLDIEMPYIYHENGKTKIKDVFLVMEYFEQNLESVFSRVSKGDFTEDHVVTIMYNMICSIKYMHSANIIHRDLKPANILITD